MTLARVLLLLAAMAGFGRLVRTAVAQPPGTTIGPVAAMASVQPGEPFAVLVQVRDVTNLNAADVRLRFDPTVLEVVDADAVAEGVQVQLLDGFLRPDFVLGNRADNAEGEVWFAATQLRPSVPVTGTGDLARIDFRGLRSGSSGIVVSEQRLVHPSGDPIAATPFELIVTVGEGGPTRTPPPTATETPSATPSPAASEPTPTPMETLSATPSPAASEATPTPTGMPTPSLEPTSTTPPETSVLYCPFASMRR